MVSINLNKKGFIIILIGLIIIILAGVSYAAWSSSKTVWHSADDVKVTISGIDYSLQEAITQGKIGSGSTTNSMTTIIARHKFDDVPPPCPNGWTKLWEGYSYAGGALDSGYASPQNLGTAGSCIETFKPLLVIECSGENQCDYETPGDFGIWLTNEIAGTADISYNAGQVEDKIARCVVCEKSSPILVRHSLTANMPPCPNGWTKLWEGYSYAGGYLAPGYESPQDLGTAGSCIETFKPIPFIECRTADICNYITPGDYSQWLTTETENTDPVVGINKIESKLISRCAVCSK